MKLPDQHLSSDSAKLDFPGLLCFTSIETGNTDAAFSNTGIKCKDSETYKFWRHAYDPSYRVNGSVCAGYMNINESEIKCSVAGFDDLNIRRLCKCMLSGISITTHEFASLCCIATSIGG